MRICGVKRVWSRSALLMLHARPSNVNYKKENEEKKERTKPHNNTSRYALSFASNGLATRTNLPPSTLLSRTSTD
jgi:hypothetical protein